MFVRKASTRLLRRFAPTSSSSTSSLLSPLSSSAAAAFGGVGARRWASSLVVTTAEAGGSLDSGVAAAVTAAKALGGDVNLLVVGHDVSAAAKAAAAVKDVQKVLVADDASLAHALPEATAPTVANVIKANKYSHVLMNANTDGKNLLPRVAALLDVNQLSEVIGVVNESTFKRPTYAGNAIATVESNEAFKLMTIRATAFDKAEMTGGAAAEEKVSVEAVADGGGAKYVSAELAMSDRPELTSAAKVVSGGRGVKNKENFEKLIFPLADAMGAAVGASRAAVDAGFVGNEHQVGQTGVSVGSDLYIAIGISGAIQHVAGMRDCKKIVAINKDEEAPIFAIADYGLVKDLFEVVPEMTEKVKK